MKHALPQEELVGKNGFTAEFNDPTRDGKLVETVLDHSLVSPSLVSQEAPLRLRKGSGRIEHEAYLAQVEKRGAVRHQRPSDHRPVSAVIGLDSMWVRPVHGVGGLSPCADTLSTARPMDRTDQAAIALSGSQMWG